MIKLGAACYVLDEDVAQAHHPVKEHVRRKLRQFVARELERAHVEERRDEAVYRTELRLEGVWLTKEEGLALQRFLGQVGGSTGGTADAAYELYDSLGGAEALERLQRGGHE